MTFTYRSTIGFAFGSDHGSLFRAFSPTENAEFGEPFYSASVADVERAAALAQQAFYTYSVSSGPARAQFLKTIAKEMESRIPQFVEFTCRETGLPEARIRGESARTIAQLNLFAQLLEEGSWQQARIDHGDPQRSPLPKPDVRSLAIAIGPVAVFGASNFPLAFSVAGVDTVSALAAGCPVIVKAHPAHPHTSELAAQAISSAVKQCGLPAGVFSHLIDNGTTIGTALVKHPFIKAVGFTGSLRGGRALFDIANARPEPIPVYAEMGSTNPQFLLPAALRARAENIAEGLAASVTNGVGQFCTCPGVVFALQGDDYQRFKTVLLQKLQTQTAAPMLTASIADNYVRGFATQAHVGTVLLPSQQQGCTVTPGLIECGFSDYAQHYALRDEVFGPSTVLVKMDNSDQMLTAANALAGQLAASLHCDDADHALAQSLFNVLQHKSGRVQFNGFPTGVEVCHAMVHGGPYPACTNAATTSVGSNAIDRFVRRVAFQNAPDALLPDALKECNPLHIWRLVDGEFKR